MLETERLLLRRWRETDRVPFARMNADARVMEFYPVCMTEEETRSYIHKIEGKHEKNGFGFWAMELKETGEFIGFVGLNIPDLKAAFTPCVEVGWRLAYTYWGRGYATEGAEAALEYGFKHRRLKEILSWTFEGNIRSRKVMERLGMTHSSADDFMHPALPADHKLSKHVLYRINNPYQE